MTISQELVPRSHRDLPRRFDPDGCRDTAGHHLPDLNLSRVYPGVDVKPGSGRGPLASLNERLTGAGLNRCR